MTASFARPVVGTFAAYLAGLVANLVVSIIVARALGPSGAGLIALVLLGPNLLALLGNLGLPRAVSHFLNRRPFSPRRIVGWSVLLSLAAGLLLMAAYLLLLPWLRELLPMGHWPRAADIVRLTGGQAPIVLWTLAAIIIPLEILQQNAMATCQGGHRFAARNSILLLYRWLYVALVAGAFLLGHRDPLTVIVAGLAAYLVTNLASLKLAYDPLRRESLRHDPLRREPPPHHESPRPHEPQTTSATSEAGLLLRYALRVHLAAVLVYVILRGDVYLVAYFLRDHAEVGFYSRAGQVAEVIFYFMLAAENVLFPQMSSLPPAEIPAAAAKLCRRTLLAGAALVIAFEILSRWLIVLPFGAAFEPAIVPLRIILPGILAIGFAQLIFAVCNALDRPWVPALVAAAGLATITALDFLWIPRYGIQGAALASLVGYVAIGGATLIWFARAHQRRLREFLVPRREDFESFGRLLTGWRRS